jgi:Ca2+-binding EF-hand superfamily protein
MTTLNGKSILAGINSGLNNTYALLAQQSSGGVTLASIADSQTNAAKTGINQTFASYLTTNFSAMDADKDGILSSTELTDTTNQLSTKGVTQAQLTQLGTASGLSAEALSEVLGHFAQIDTNGDGKVTSGEITAFNLTSAMEKKKIEFSNKAATNMSVFYGDDSTAAADDSSLIDYKYLSDNK